MQIFVLGVPHTQTLSPKTPGSHTTCAFTSKVWNLCRMMYERGHEVIHLGVPGSEPICTKHIDVVPLDRWKDLYGNRKDTDFYNTQHEGTHAPYMAEWAKNARAAILKESGVPWTSILCCSWGGAQQTAVEGLPQFAVESGIGYMHTWAKYRIYESYAWLHWHMGKQGLISSQDQWYHVVIPNAFDPDLFGPVVPTRDKQDYFLIMCRFNEDKGVRLACQIARATKTPIRIIGQGDPSPFLGEGVTYIKPVGAEERRQQMRYAKALFSPSLYAEPFGGVAVEAMMSGCPVITTDFGAYPETVPHGHTGYRCRTWDQFEWAARNVNKIDPYKCRKWAVDNYSLSRIGRMYEDFFTDLLRLKNDGWATKNPERKDLDCLKVSYPFT